MIKKFHIRIKEWRIILGICIIFSLRSLGMFIIFPVFSTYGIYLKDSTIFLVGLAMGAYGFFQAIFQIPYGWLSDKIGRKFSIILGLVFFLIGSLICLNSNSIFGMLLGRSLQGSGAISSVCMALLSDVISKENRIKAMGCLGISFCISFVLSVVLSPIMVRMFGLHFLFLITCLCSVVCILVAFYAIPYFKIKNSNLCVKTECKNILNVLKNSNLFKLNLSNFFLHFILILYFIVVPIQLSFYRYVLDFSWIIYLVSIVVSFFIVFPLIKYIQNNSFRKNFIFSLMIFLVISDIFSFFFRYYIFLFFLNLQIFFIAFSFFEITLPILVSKNSPKNYKGTSMAVYSISQFLGSSIGGILGGFFLHYFNSNILFLFKFIVVVFWFLINILCF
ncbi:MAG: MFS transporter [Buchnera aphidicola (Nurudea yanoniella)]